MPPASKELANRLITLDNALAGVFWRVVEEWLVVVLHELFIDGSQVSVLQPALDRRIDPVLLDIKQMCDFGDLAAQILFVDSVETDVRMQFVERFAGLGAGINSQFSGRLDRSIRQLLYSNTEEP
jgi:hypothetical protein